MPLEEAPEDGEEEIYFVPHDDGEVVFGAGEVSTVYYDALVDSGASFNALAKALAKYLKNKRRGRTSVRDYTGNLRTMANWSGNVGGLHRRQPHRPRRPRLLRCRRCLGRRRDAQCQ